MSYVVCVCINRTNFTSLCMARLDWYKALHYLCFRFQDLIGMSVTRNSKIQRYKEQKELEKKLHDLRDVVEQETVDDEVKVRFYYKFVVRALLGTQCEMPSSAPAGQVFFSGYSGFHPPLINNRLDISAIFLKGPLNSNIYFYHKLARERQKVCLGCIVIFKGKQLCHFQFCLPSCKGPLLKERICSYRSKFFPLTVDPILVGNWKSQKLFPLCRNGIKTLRCTHTSEQVSRPVVQSMLA